MQTIQFQKNKNAFALSLESFSDIQKAILQLEIRIPNACIVLVGGAGGISDDEMSRVEKFLREVIIPFAESRQLVVLDGGTDAGIMRLVGRARAEMDGTFPLIGIVAVDTVFWPGRAPVKSDASALEPNHPFFLFAPGKDWGAESPWIAKTATVISGSLPSITILLNGGEIALQDVARSLAENRQVLTVAGSGRKADVLAAALSGTDQGEAIQKLVDTNLIQAIEIRNQPSNGLDILAKFFDKK